MNKHNISFEKASHTLKSDSLNVKQTILLVCWLAGVV